MKVKAKKIAIYPNAGITALKDVTDIDSFLADVRSGRWQDPILKLRAAGEKDQEDIKKKLPDVTISGIFSERTNETIVTHSGYIAVDIDEQDNLIDIPGTRDIIGADPFVYACFISCRGKGLCAIVKVNPRAHVESYGWMSRYFYNKYNLHTDPVCYNLARIRFISYDPDATLNPNAVECPAEPKPKKEKAAFKEYVFKSDDFDRILKEVQEKQINLTETYEDWMLCALSLQNKFEPDTAREYYHLISTIHGEYDPDKTDKKFDSLLKDNRGEIPIDWFYNHVEKHGIKPYGKETEAALMFQIFEDEENRDPDISPTLAKKALDEMPLATKIKMYLRHRHKEYIKNLFTETITADGEVVTDDELNAWYVDILERVDERASFDLVKRVMFSIVVKHHPFKEFIQPYLDNPPEKPKGYIDEIISCIHTDTPHAGVFIKKWLVSMVASAFGTPSVFVLVFCGDQDTGKSEWFKRILPEPLSMYRASLSWTTERDEIIRMSRNLIMVDDEMGNKSQREEKQIKKITSIDKEQTRAAYASMDKYYHRLAIFCGATNDDWFLSDPTGNRRFLPVYLTKKMEYERFNNIDKGLLFHELYQEWKSGYSLSLSPEEQRILNENSAKFTKPHLEEELVQKYIDHPTDSDPGEFMTATDIYGYLKSKYPWQPIKMNLLGSALKKSGFKSKQKRVNGKMPHLYTVVKVNTDFTEFKDEEEQY